MANGKSNNDNTNNKDANEPKESAKWKNQTKKKTSERERERKMLHSFTEREKKIVFHLMLYSSSPLFIRV